MNPLKKLGDYLRSVTVELRNVSWPTQRQTINYSALVIGISVIMAAAFAGLDFGFTKIAELGAAARNNAAASANQSASTTPTTPTAPVIDFNEIPSTSIPTTSTK